MRFLLAGYLAWQLIAGVITFAFYVWDKRQAKKNGWRVPEKRLHLLAAIGGWCGAAIGQKYVRHKSQKLSFKIVTVLSALFHSAITVAMVYWWITVGG